MRKALFLFLLLISQIVFGQKHELGLTLGGLFPQDRGAVPNLVHLGSGTAWQANYGYRLAEGRAAVFGEVHFLASPQRLVRSDNPASTRDVATIYVTPGIRVKFVPRSQASPYVAIGGGYAVYEQSLLRLDGKPNSAARDIHRAVVDFGAGIDARVWRWFGLRGEIRDFYSGSPAYNLPGLGGGQHNLVAGGGFLLKWGE